MLSYIPNQLDTADGDVSSANSCFVAARHILK